MLVLEGSLKPKISIYQKLNGEYKKTDSLYVFPRTYEIGFDRSYDNLLSLSNKHLNIYNFLSVGKLAKN